CYTRHRHDGFGRAAGRSRRGCGKPKRATIAATFALWSSGLVMSRGLQAELLDRGLSPKYGKNILSGSLRALIAQALDDKALPADPFPRRLKRPKWKPPGADPFAADERTAILHWFERKRFGLRPGPDFTHASQVAHPSYHAFIHTLFWTGLRPSEAAGLQWQDLDLPPARLHAEPSRHLYEDRAPQTAA